MQLYTKLHFSPRTERDILCVDERTLSNKTISHAHWARSIFLLMWRCRNIYTRKYGGCSHDSLNCMFYSLTCCALSYHRGACGRQCMSQADDVDNLSILPLFHSLLLVTVLPFVWGRSLPVDADASKGKCSVYHLTTTNKFHFIWLVLSDSDIFRIIF